MKRVIILILCLTCFGQAVKGQSAQVTISLNEQFFDALLDAAFTNLKQPSFPLSSVPAAPSGDALGSTAPLPAYQNALVSWTMQQTIFNGADSRGVRPLDAVAGTCDESIRIHREIDGVRTAVSLRDGEIHAPIAFSGSYNPPLIGCLDFQGWADSKIDLEFDPITQALTGHATVLNVNLSGTGGVGSSLIAKLVQSSIDGKINPIKILDLEKISFVVPVQNSGSLRMKATGITTEVGNGVLNVHITYEFLKG